MVRFDCPAEVDGDGYEGVVAVSTTEGGNGFSDVVCGDVAGFDVAYVV